MDDLSIQTIMSPNYVFWVSMGVLLIIFEVAIMPGVGFLFAGLGALTLGSMIAFQLFIFEGWASNIAAFFCFTTIWAVILWKPLKKAIKNSKGEEYQNIVGTHAEVSEEKGLIAGKQGTVKWSGTTMRARISPDSELEEIKKGETVWVHNSKGGILYVDVKEPEKE